MTAEPRLCGHCNRPLPAGARRSRVYCSSSCRGAAWNAANPREVPGNPRIAALHSTSNPKHYHRAAAGVTYLAGHRTSPPWFGTACPPECPGLLDGERYGGPMEDYWRTSSEE